MARSTFPRQLRRVTALLLAPLLLAAGLSLTSAVTPAYAAPNKIVVENQLAGSPASQWDVTGAGDLTLQGFATQMSVAPGETVAFKINDTTVTQPAASGYRIDIYRLGYYGGAGARLVGTIAPSSFTQPVQPACTLTDPAGARLLDCGNWAVTASWQVPGGAVSGIYIARPTRTSDAALASHITFVVRDDGGQSEILLQTSDTTWQAYNPYGGYNLYTGSDGSLDSNAWKVSYNRPFTTRVVDQGENWLFNSEYPMLSWLERNGYDVSYTTHIDVGLHPERLADHKVFMSSGHDEYWSQAQRDAVEAARDQGVNLAFFSGNEVYWRIRYEDSLSGSSGDRRTMVVYKEGSLAPSPEGEHRRCYLNFNCDPDSSEWTGLWREKTDATKTQSLIGSPENALTGQISWRNNTSDITVPSDYASLRFWRNTAVASLTGTQKATLASGTLGYEWSPQYEQYMGSYPAGRVLLSSTSAMSTFAGVDQHHLSLYRAPSGALVFGAGTVQWAWGLDSHHDRAATQSSSTPDPTMQQATVNLLADMGAQPTTLQSGLLTAAKSLDVTAPTVAITSPGNGASVPAGPVTVTGTASDVGGAVGVVEVSTDGTVWRPATGTGTWSYSFIAAPGTTTIHVRAADDSANIGAEITRSITVTARICNQSSPCSIFTGQPNAIQDPDNRSTEVGVKFRSSTAGYITGVRFYKTAGNTGTHTGSLWSAAGTNLSSAVFTGESSTGWQEVTFGAAVAIAANTTYVASYHAPNGHYSDGQAFTYTSVDNPPLNALKADDTGPNGPNGLYTLSSTPTFPTEAYGSSNYLVDVVFTTTVGADTTGPVITATHAAANANGTVTITWTTDEPSTSRVDYGVAANQLSSSRADATLATTHSVTIPGVAQTIYYRVTSADASTNSTTSPALINAPGSFTMPPPAATDDTVADFSAGTPGTGTYVSNTSGGEVILAPTVGAEFEGTSLPGGWTSTKWDASAAGSVVSGGQVKVDGSLLRTDATYASGHSLEFVATFTGTANEHAGFAADFNAPRWAIFSTSSGGSLWARVNNDGAGHDIDLGPSYLGSPHRYRINWAADTVTFSIDGTVVSTMSATVIGAMEPAISDLNAGGTALAVDWMRLTPYAQSGNFLSRIHDAGGQADWGTFSWTGPTPTGTGLTMSVRTGNTAAPDSTWTAFTGIQNGADVTTRGRYLQYRADAVSTDTGATPELASVTVPYSVLSDQTAPVITGRTPAPGATGVAPNTAVTIGFNENVAPASFTATSVRLYANGSSTDVTAARTVNGSLVTLTPAAPLAVGTVYTVAISTAVTDLVGNPLGSPDSWTFTVTSTFTSTPVPTIAGSPVVGTTLTATLPPWTPAATSVSWQWYADGVAIQDATASSFTLTSTQLGKVITVQATGHASGLTDQTRVSQPTAAVTQPQVTAGTVTITGTAVVGGTLGVNLGSWTPTGVAFTYQWLRDGTTAIPSATGPTYSPVAADLGHTLAVSVTGTKAGYVSATAVSTATVSLGAAPGTFRSVSLARLFDTRVSVPKLGGAQTRTLQVTGVGGVPATGVSAVVLNVTVTETTSSGFLTVSPTGTSRPDVSNLNWTAGVTIPNAVTVKVGTNGSIDLYQSGPGSAHVVVDVSGYYVDGVVSAAGGFTSIAPSRILDTRTAGGGGTLGAGEARDLQILGAGGVPNGNVSAVVLNVTVTDTTASGFLTVFPSGTATPVASNLNWTAGKTIPNLVTVKVGASGKVSIFQSGPGTAQVVVDVAGYFLGGTPTLPGTFVALSPARILDTRNSSTVAANSERTLPVLGTGGIPSTGVAALVINTTVTDTRAPGFLTVYPSTNPLPTASNLNWSAAGTTIPNLVTVQVGSNGSVTFHNTSPGTTQVVADVAGYYIGS